MSHGSKKDQSKLGLDRFSPILDILNTEPDLRSSSAISLNLDLELGPVQTGSGLNCGSELNIGITINITLTLILIVVISSDQGRTVILLVVKAITEHNNTRFVQGDCIVWRGICLSYLLVTVPVLSSDMTMLYVSSTPSLSTSFTYHVTYVMLTLPFHGISHMFVVAISQ